MKPMDSAKRDSLIEAAIQLFAEKGFDAASVKDITQRADVAKGTLYVHFKDKEDLVEQVFAFCHRQNVEACDLGLDREPTAIGKLCLRMENAIRWAIEHPREALVDRMYLNHPSRYSLDRSGYSRQAHFGTVDPIIRQGIADGELKNLPSTLLGEVFFGVVSAYYFYFLNDPRLLQDQALWQTCRQSVVDCLAARA